jgi:F-type H+-transporting ATPase subunit b
MDQTLQALGGILLKAIPTAVLLLVLLFYFKAMLFGPLDRILEQRRELTEGARQAAERSLATADQKSREFEAKLREARAQIYKEQEEIRRKWLEDQSAQVAQARAKMEASVKDAKQSLAAEAAAARASLVSDSAALADQIATAVLTRRAG